MLSGRMSTVVSPHNMLYTVWNIIPFFRGYSQQDAQEFLSYVAALYFFLCLLLLLYSILLLTNGFMTLSYISIMHLINFDLYSGLNS